MRNYHKTQAFSRDKEFKINFVTAHLSNLTESRHSVPIYRHSFKNAD